MPSYEEHYLKGLKVIGEKRISDSHFMISRKEIAKRYHIECQNRPDASILKRMVGYDSRIAIENSEIEADQLTMEQTMQEHFPVWFVLLFYVNCNA